MFNLRIITVRAVLLCYNIEEMSLSDGIFLIYLGEF
jgi:hypothetical protein